MRAPLNSRVVSGTGHRDKGKGKAKEKSLYGVPVEIQEALVLEDLLFVLMVRDFPPPRGCFVCRNAFGHLAVIYEHDACSRCRSRGRVLLSSLGMWLFSTLAL